MDLTKIYCLGMGYISDWSLGLDFTEMILIAVGQGQKANINQVIPNISCDDGKQPCTAIGRSGEPYVMSAFSQVVMMDQEYHLRKDA